MQVGDGVYDIYTLNGLFGGPAGRTDKRPEIVDQVTEQQLEQLDVSVVKKELCESEDDCKEFNF